MSSIACLIHTAKNKNAYPLVVTSRPFFLSQVFPRKLSHIQFPFGHYLNLTLTTPNESEKCDKKTILSSCWLLIIPR